MDASESSYRVDRKLLLGELPLVGILLADVAFGLWALPRLPERIPIHWSLAGEADGWGARWPHAIVLPLIGLACWAALLLLPLVDPLRRNYGRFPGTLRLFRWLVPLLCVGLHVAAMLSSLGVPVDHGVAGRVILGVVFVLLGNSMGKLRHNWFVGIRTPWTLANEEVWTRTHRLAAPIWVGGGVVLLAGASLRGTAGEVLLAAALAAMVLVPVAYSFLVFRRLAG